MKPPLGTNQTAKAKVNLSLHVTGRRADGYHLLDSLVAFADVGDQLTFTPANTMTLKIDGPFGAGLTSDADNLVLRAAGLFDAANTAKIILQKNLPVASGIGGGSADAAATLRGLSDLWDLPVPDAQKVLELGADVPVCLAQSSARMQGIGDVLTSVDFPQLPCVLVNPMIGVSTAAIFAQIDRVDNLAMVKIPDAWAGVTACIEWLNRQRNDLQAAATKIAPQIDDCIAALKKTDAGMARMSGSGATCFGLYKTITDAQHAADQIKKIQPDWWVMPTLLS